jgi:predicted membrane protein
MSEILGHPLFFPLIAMVLATCVFWNGRRFARMTSNPLAGKQVLGIAVEGSQLAVSDLNRIGRLQMYLAPPIGVIMIIVSIFDGQ